MRRILLLLATMALGLVVVGGVATSKQPQDQQQEAEEEGTTLSPATTTLSPTTDDGGGTDDASIQGTTTPPIGHQDQGARQQSAAATAKDKSDDDKGSSSIPRSTVVKASFANGTGANFLGVKVSDHGNLTSFESPAGQEQVFAGNEGYAVCSFAGVTVHGHDTGSVEGGFAAPTFSQPTAGAFPLTVTRRTTDGKFQLTQVWAKPDTVEKDVTLTMTLKNISGAAITGTVLLSRSGDFDIGNSTTSSTDRAATTRDSVWLWDDISTGDPGGLMLSALTLGTSHLTRVEARGVWADPVSGSRSKCFFPSETTPTNPAGDFAMGMTYDLGSFNTGQSKTVKYGYRRM